MNNQDVYNEEHFKGRFFSENPVFFYSDLNGVIELSTCDEYGDMDFSIEYPIGRLQDEIRNVLLEYVEYFESCDSKFEEDESENAKQRNFDNEENSERSYWIHLESNLHNERELLKFNITMLEYSDKSLAKISYNPENDTFEIESDTYLSKEEVEEVILPCWKRIRWHFQLIREDIAEIKKSEAL